MIKSWPDRNFRSSKALSNSSFTSTFCNHQNQILPYYIATTPPQENVLVKIEIVNIIPVKIPQIWALAFSKGKTNKTTTKTKKTWTVLAQGEILRYLRVINTWYILWAECLTTVPCLPNKDREVLVLVKTSSSPRATRKCQHSFTSLVRSLGPMQSLHSTFIESSVCVNLKLLYKFFS